MDYRLVEFVFGFPDALKLRDGYTKYALRRAMAAQLPEWLIGQRRKQRFAAPYKKWFRGPWRRLIEEHFLEGSFECQTFLETRRFRAELDGYLHGQPSTLTAGMLWRILNTEVWLRAFRSLTSWPQ
jgi:asparagine synthase (glutamine-hydrolysing)